MKNFIRVFSLLIVVIAMLYGNLSQNVSIVKASSTLDTENVDMMETGTLEINVLGRDWSYSHTDPSGFEHFIRKLSNVEFTIYRNGKEYIKNRTSQDGKMNIKLPIGDYTFTQTTAYPNYPKYLPYPENRWADFFPDKKKFSVHIERDKTNSYNVYNDPIPMALLGLNPW